MSIAFPISAPNTYKTCMSFLSACIFPHVSIYLVSPLRQTLVLLYSLARVPALPGSTPQLTLDLLWPPSTPFCWLLIWTRPFISWAGSSRFLGPLPRRTTLHGGSHSFRTSRYNHGILSRVFSGGRGFRCTQQYRGRLTLRGSSRLATFITKPLGTSRWAYGGCLLNAPSVVEAA